MERFEDDARHLIDFIDRVLVICDRCGAPGTVMCAQPYSGHQPSFLCSRCSNHRRGWGEGWLGPEIGVGRHRCGACGDLLETPSDHAASASKQQSVAVFCPTCREKNHVRIKWKGIRLGVPHDPYFGIDLALQTGCCGETLWAYNEAHLDFLKHYVGAGLRERDGNENRSLASRLPKWMKKAGNREAIAKAIARLEKVANEVSRRG